MNKTLRNTCLFLLLLMVYSCNDGNNKSISETKEAIKQTKSVVENASKAQTYVEQLRHHKTRLEAMEPLNPQLIIDWFPQQLDNMVQTKLKKGRSGFKEASVATAYYSNNAKGSESKRLDIEIMDGAGPQGSMVVPGQIARKDFNLDQETDLYSQKNLQHNGLEAHQMYDKKSNGTTLSFAYGERFGLLVNSENMSPEETWVYVDKLDLEKLMEL